MFWRFRRIFATDGEIDLVPIDLYPPDEEMGFGDCFDFLITPHGKKREIGRVSLRTGESECMYYFGHIGYHIDPPYRGHHYASKACRLLVPLLQVSEMASAVITCDPDNIPSRKTIESLGCEYECTVPVPQVLQDRWGLSPVKERHIWRIAPSDLNHF